jgi:hypothetical protein
MDNTIIQQGHFTSTGAPVRIPLRSDVDWMHVINWTQSLAATINTGVEFWWQREMPVLDSLCYYHVAATNALSSGSAFTLSSGLPSFQLFDDSASPYGPNVAITRIPANGVVLGTTVGLYVGSVVRFNNVLLGLQHCNDMLYSVSAVNPGVSFTITPAANNVDTGVTTGNYQIVAHPELYYPRNRRITNISQAANGIVTTAIPHGMTVGQQVRFDIPQVTALAYGMLQLNGVTANVVAVPTLWTFVIDIDTTGFGAFAFPLTADIPFTYAQMIPVGEDTRVGLLGGGNILADATDNIGAIGMTLFPGAYGPAGQQGDVIKWVAGKSFAWDL